MQLPWWEVLLLLLLLPPLRLLAQVSKSASTAISMSLFSIIYCTYSFLNLAFLERHRAIAQLQWGQTWSSHWPLRMNLLCLRAKKKCKCHLCICPSCLPQVAHLLGWGLQRGTITNREFHIQVSRQQHSQIQINVMEKLSPGKNYPDSVPVISKLKRYLKIKQNITSTNIML